MPPQIAIIIPVCDEAPVIGSVLEELLRVVDPARFAIAVGVNGSRDDTAAIAARYPVIVAETEQRGYGFGCMAAIRRAELMLPSLRAFIFFAGDGASDPHDVGAMADAYERGYTFVLGARTGRVSNWPVMRLSHVVANCVLAAWCGLLAGRTFKDLAPLRLIETKLFHAMALQEMTYGWTIEAQLAAARLGAAICELPARERPRLAGEQKVSGVTWRRTVTIGCRIVAAGLRAKRRLARAAQAQTPFMSPAELLPEPNRSV